MPGWRRMNVSVQKDAGCSGRAEGREADAPSSLAIGCVPQPLDKTLEGFLQRAKGSNTFTNLGKRNIISKRYALCVHCGNSRYTVHKAARWATVLVDHCGDV